VLSSAVSAQERSPGASLTRWQVLAVAGVVVVGGVLRFAHLRSGVPYAAGVDEPDIRTSCGGPSG
jgi:hypothetical protein